MSVQTKPTSRRSGASSQRRRSSTAQQRQTAKRGSMPPWLHEWIAQLAIVCATIGARIRRIGPRARTVMR